MVGGGPALIFGRLEPARRGRDYGAMSRFSIRHETRYDYEHPVRFGPHKLLVRPRDSHAIRLIAADARSLTGASEGSWGSKASLSSPLEGT